MRPPQLDNLSEFRTPPLLEEGTHGGWLETAGAAYEQ